MEVTFSLSEVSDGRILNQDLQAVVNEGRLAENISLFFCLRCDNRIIRTFKSRLLLITCISGLLSCSYKIPNLLMHVKFLSHDAKHL